MVGVDQGPAALVHGPVVVAAQQDKVGQVGGSELTPPQWTTWWAEVQDGGRSQPGQRQPRSRALRARRVASGTTRSLR
ncbi:MAG TPA: hypothetical protein VIG86_04185, partial [Candidatus Dormibacteraeota bacterium]